MELDVPAGIAGLLSNQVAVNDKCRCIPDLVDLMISSQSPWLDYLK